MYNFEPPSEPEKLSATPPPVSPVYGSGSELQRPTFYIKMSKPVVSRVIMGVLLAMFLVEVVYGIVRYNSWMTFSGANIYMLVDLGAKVNEYVAGGEIWRLFTATLLHDGIIHLLFNLYALFALGPMLEAYIGPARFAAIYILGGLFGSLLSYAFSDSVSVGASGAIFGIIGATTVYFFRYRNNFGPQGRAILQNMLVVIVINLVFGFSSGFIDNFGHIGGLLGGAFVAIGLMPRYEKPTVVRMGEQPLEVVNRRPWEVVWVVVCTIIFIGGVLLVNYKYTQSIWGITG
jgi:rhomboid protease GluP